MTIDEIEKDLEENPPSEELIAEANEFNGDYVDTVEETTENTTDDEANEETEENDVSKDKKGEENQSPLYVAKRKGKEYPIYDEKQVETLINQGLDYNFKMRDLKEAKRVIATVNEHGGEEWLNTVIEASNGNKEALVALLSKTGIDPMDLISEEGNSDYKPQNHIKAEDEGESVIEELQNNPDLANKVVELSKYANEDFITLLDTNPVVLKGFADDVKNGIATKSVLEEAERITTLQGGGAKEFIQNYIQVVQTQATSKASSKPKDEVNPTTDVGIPRGKSTSPKQQTGIDDTVWQMSDEEFDKEFNRMMRGF